ncbi:MAG: hypothetical protein FWG10_14710 [Eubacteriaceae bacterium]|nr:hypothetical protein [Eubacteriaceae bacterium]
MDIFDENRYQISLDQRLDLFQAASALAENGQWKLMDSISEPADLVSDTDGFFTGLKSNSPDSMHPLYYKEICFFNKNTREIIYNTSFDANRLQECIEKKRQLEQEIINLANTNRNSNNSFDFSKLEKLLFWKAKHENEAKEILNQEKVSVLAFRRTAHRGDYIIRKGQTTYSLQIVSVEARIYATGTMLVSLHCNNTKYSELADIAKINCLGRRLFSPYLSIKEKDRNVEYSAADEAPDSSELFLEHEDSCSIVEKISIIKEGFFAVPESFSFLNCLLSDKFTSHKFARNNQNKHQIHVASCNDERMFVHCYVKNDSLIQSLEKVFPDRHSLLSINRNRPSQEPLKQWYALVVVDININSPTCKSKEQLLNEINEYTYDRWLDTKMDGNSTIMGITSDSFIQLTNTGAPDFLGENFNWHYFQLACISMLYRTSVQRYYEEAAGASTCGKISSKAAIGKLLGSINESYLHFQNKMWFPEVTAQRQGKDLFRILHNAMEIQRDVEILEHLLEVTHAFGQTISSNMLDNRMEILTVLGAGFLFFEIVIRTILQDCGFIANLLSWILQTSVFLLLAVATKKILPQLAKLLNRH